MNKYLFAFQPQSNRTKHVCFVDWQVIRFVSPVTDLLYAIFIGSDKDFRRKEHQRLIKFYYDTLSTQIRRLGSDPNNVYPYSVFQEHLKRFAVIIFIDGRGYGGRFGDHIRFGRSIDENDEWRQRRFFSWRIQ